MSNNAETVSVAERVFVENRELYRFASGEYKRLPDSVLAKLWAHEIEIHQEHFLHLANSKPGMVAYTESWAKGIKDRQTVTRFGRYLAKFHGDALNAEDIAALSNALRVAQEPVPLMFAKTQEDIKRVYINGPHSCMAYKVSAFASAPYHPAEVYASEDCAVAYIQREERITGRAVVNMVDMLYCTVYGDDETLTELLKHAGFKYSGRALEGCKVLRLEAHNGGIVLPYLDGAGGASDMGDHIVLSGYGEFSGSETNGLAECPIAGYCDCCGEGIVGEDNIHSAYNGNEILCEGCADWHYRWSDSDETLVHGDDDDHIELPSGYFIRFDDAERYGYIWMDDLGEMVARSECTLDINGDWQLLDDCTFCYIDDGYALTADVTEYTTAKGETRYTVSDPTDDADYVPDSDAA